jgi:uncharacterized protein (TIGR03086 family)
MDPRDNLDVCIDELERLVHNIRPEQLRSPTPCKKWDVRGLVNHFVGGGHMFAAAFRGEDVVLDPDAPMPDLVGDDPAGAFDKAIVDFRSAVRSEGALDRMITLPFATLPGAVATQVAAFDLAVHCWDVARATGQQVDLPEDIVTGGEAVARQMISPEARDGDTFAAEVTPPAPTL